jgi:hypothetical protein
MMQNEVLGFEFIKELLKTDSFFGPIVEDINSGVRSDYGLYNGFLFKGHQLCIPDYSLRLKIIQEHHNEGHMGQDKTVLFGGRIVLLAKLVEGGGKIGVVL